MKTLVLLKDIVKEPYGLSPFQFPFFIPHIWRKSIILEKKESFCQLLEQIIVKGTFRLNIPRSIIVATFLLKMPATWNHCLGHPCCLCQLFFVLQKCKTIVSFLLNKHHSPMSALKEVQIAVECPNLPFFELNNE